jgi:hypothetical protein
MGSFLGLVACGCGTRPAIGEVDGQIRLGGQPLPHVQVQFVPDPEKGTTGPMAMAVTDDDGRYTLRLLDDTPGAVVGHHRVVILTTEAGTGRRGRSRTRSGEGSAAGGAPTHPEVPSVYHSLASTPLAREVRPGKQTIDIDLP